jgi:hypothetical protein
VTTPPFDCDIRSTDPDQTGHRRARFRDGWREAAKGHYYPDEVLRALTWDNLGNRLGALFPAASPQLVDELYEWCVRQQREQGQPAAGPRRTESTTAPAEVAAD